MLNQAIFTKVLCKKEMPFIRRHTYFLGITTNDDKPPLKKGEMTTHRILSKKFDRGS